MTPEQKQLVAATWAMVSPIADTAADLFYDRLFAIDPTLRRLFRNTDMAVQKRKLIGALDATVAGLEHVEALAPTLKELGRRHAGYGVADTHYATVGAALLWTLEQGLGAAWSPAAADAWASAYGVVADTMMAGAAETPASKAAALKGAA